MMTFLLLSDYHLACVDVKSIFEQQNLQNSEIMITPILQISENIISDAQLASAVAVILGAVFVLFQLNQNNRLVSATAEQAKAAAVQAKLSNEQMKQNNELANMDLVMRLYEFANTAEVQSSWITVLHTKISSKEDFGMLPKSDQVAYYQIAALFESLGVLVERNFVKLDIIDDTFQIELAWKMLEPFIKGTRRRLEEEETYVFFEKLVGRIRKLQTNSAPEPSNSAKSSE
jgi:hypothetical protein